MNESMFDKQQRQTAETKQCQVIDMIGRRPSLSPDSQLDKRRISAHNIGIDISDLSALYRWNKIWDIFWGLRLDHRADDQLSWVFYVFLHPSSSGWICTTFSCLDLSSTWNRRIGAWLRTFFFKTSCLFVCLDKYLPCVPFLFSFLEMILCVRKMFLKHFYLFIVVPENMSKNKKTKKQNRRNDNTPSEIWNYRCIM